MEGVQQVSWGVYRLTGIPGRSDTVRFSDGEGRCSCGASGCEHIAVARAQWCNDVARRLVKSGVCCGAGVSFGDDTAHIVSALLGASTGRNVNARAGKKIPRQPNGSGSDDARAG